VKPGGDLNQTVHVDPFDAVEHPPHLFPELVRFEVLPAIERDPPRLEPDQPILGERTHARDGSAPSHPLPRPPAVAAPPGGGRSDGGKRCGAGFRHAVRLRPESLGAKAPAGAPNILYVVLDDVGYGWADTFGGLVETPSEHEKAPTGGTCRRSFGRKVLPSSAPRLGRGRERNASARRRPKQPK